MDTFATEILASFPWTCACGARIARGEAHYCSLAAAPTAPVKPMLRLIDGGQSNETVE